MFVIKAAKGLKIRIIFTTSARSREGYDLSALFNGHTLHKKDGPEYILPRLPHEAGPTDQAMDKKWGVGDEVTVCPAGSSSSARSSTAPPGLPSFPAGNLLGDVSPENDGTSK